MPVPAPTGGGSDNLFQSLGHPFGKGRFKHVHDAVEQRLLAPVDPLDLCFIPRLKGHGAILPLRL
jgi:hypothetical protein